jgi:hypothetical protein
MKKHSRPSPGGNYMIFICFLVAGNSKSKNASEIPAQIAPFCANTGIKLVYGSATDFDEIDINLSCSLHSVVADLESG